MTVDGVEYPGLAELTGYGTPGGLKGVNCKHEVNAYFPGITRLPDREFKADAKRFGMDSEEYYAATQRQRELERRVRKTKHDLAGYERANIGLENPAYVQKRLVLGRQQKDLQKWCKQKGLRRHYEREKAYGVDKQPRALWAKLHRKIGDTAFRSESDVMFEALGSARKNNVDEMNEYIERIHSLGGTVVLLENGRRTELVPHSSRPRISNTREGVELTCAYMPSSKKGVAGTLEIPADASISAWMHEMDHLLYDEEHGFPGSTAILMPEHIIAAGKRAYNIEIELAQSIGRPDLADKLRMQLSERLRSWW